MSEAKFTKGEWAVKGDWMIVDKNERLIAQFEPLNDELSNCNTPESFANAHLIACATEMYAMLEKLADCDECQMHKQAINALLEKARGGK